MKSYLLIGIENIAVAERTLDVCLPGQRHPWLLLSDTGDAIAYFNIDECLDGTAMPHIAADVSGKHFDRDEAVLTVLEALRSQLGGRIEASP